MRPIQRGRYRLGQNGGFRAARFLAHRLFRAPRALLDGQLLQAAATAVQRVSGGVRQRGRSSAIVAAEEAEIALYERHRAFVSYGYYIAQKAGN